MIGVECEQPTRRDSAYAALKIRTAKGRCAAIALATLSLASSSTLLAAWVGTHTFSYSREALSYRRICSDMEQVLGPFNFASTVLCILGSYMIDGRRWRALFAVCAVLGTICYCLMAFQSQMVRE